MKIVFEGYCDQKAGWEFDAPLLLVAPVIQMHHVGNVHQAERVIDDYIETLSLGGIPESDGEIDRRVVRRDFQKARQGSKRFLYFRKDVEIPDDIEWGSDDPFVRIAYGTLQVGVIAATPERAACHDGDARTANRTHTADAAGEG